MAKQKPWARRVYKPSSRSRDDREAWRKLKQVVHFRDDYTCQRCQVKLKKRGKNAAQAHHLVPRSEGGADEYDNLATLCNTCHDWVELEGLRTVVEIRESYFEEDDENLITIADADSKDWHTWVYGGGKNPQVSAPVTENR